MRCPKCKSYNQRIVDSRPANNTVKRRRECLDCGFRFNTVEFSNETLQEYEEDIERVLAVLSKAKEVLK